MKKNIKTTIKKLGHLISSRILYLLMGIFLASAIMVYATWDDAKTGGSGQLSENNWNELINMLQSKLDTGILGRLGDNTDPASMSDSLFAGQQYIADNLGSGGGGPASWTCSIASSAYTRWPDTLTASCPAGYRVIAGGCYNSVPLTHATLGSYPTNQGWVCRYGSQDVWGQAFANCCQ